MFYDELKNICTVDSFAKKLVYLIPDIIFFRRKILYFLIKFLSFHFEIYFASTKSVSQTPLADW